MLGAAKMLLATASLTGLVRVSFYIAGAGGGRGGYPLGSPIGQDGGSGAIVSFDLMLPVGTSIDIGVGKAGQNGSNSATGGAYGNRGAGWIDCRGGAGGNGTTDRVNSAGGGGGGGAASVIRINGQTYGAGGGYGGASTTDYDGTTPTTYTTGNTGTATGGTGAGGKGDGHRNGGGSGGGGGGVTLGGNGGPQHPTAPFDGVGGVSGNSVTPSDALTFTGTAISGYGLNGNGSRSATDGIVVITVNGEATQFVHTGDAATQTFTVPSPGSSSYPLSSLPGATAGLIRRQYSGYMDDSPSFFYGKTHTAETVVTAMTGPVPAGDHFSLEFRGYFYVSTAGTHRFYISSDDCSYLWIGSTAIAGYNTGNAAAAHPGKHGPSEQTGASLALAVGYHPIRIQFGEYDGGESLTVSVEGPDLAKTNNPGRFYYRSGSSQGGF